MTGNPARTGPAAAGAPGASPAVAARGTVYELGPGTWAVYHFHHAAEELLLVLRGRPTLRTPDGERRLEEGEAVHFRVGPEGAHALANATDEPVR